ncbi:MAG: DNA recombination protein RmuC [Clostridia bacterium]|nr:DNA recombination protein RmuC [Clostridia bacterium]
MIEYIILGALALNLILLCIFIFKKNKNQTGNVEEVVEKAVRTGEAQLRQEISARMEAFETSTLQKLTQMSGLQMNQISETTKMSQQMLQYLSETVNRNLKEIRENNNLQMNDMRKTVDEQLNQTLEARLTKSFQTVSTQLEQVHSGLGEMKHLAQDVGDLKKVLSNVKTRGILGELQLQNILEEVMAPGQYEENVETVRGSNKRVEFAIRLPGKEDGAVYLPIDSKFPLNYYETYLNAAQTGDAQEAAECGKLLESAIRQYAKDISLKYISPPETTDFGVMFLPTEGLYAEIARRSDLLAQMQHRYKVVITGPSTLCALLSSLQMGFRTLALEKRTSEVWDTLSSVKKEFEKFDMVLQEAQTNLNKVGSSIDKLVGVRTRKILLRLREVQQPEQEEQQDV